MKNIKVLIIGLLAQSIVLNGAVTTAERAAALALQRSGAAALALQRSGAAAINAGAWRRLSTLTTVKQPSSRIIQTGTGTNDDYRSEVQNKDQRTLQPIDRPFGQPTRGYGSSFYGKGGNKPGTISSRIKARAFSSTPDNKINPNKESITESSRSLNVNLDYLLNLLGVSKNTSPEELKLMHQQFVEDNKPNFFNPLKYFNPRFNENEMNTIDEAVKNAISILNSNLNKDGNFDKFMKKIKSEIDELEPKTQKDLNNYLLELTNLSQENALISLKKKRSYLSLNMDNDLFKLVREKRLLTDSSRKIDESKIFNKLNNLLKIDKIYLNAERMIQNPYSYFSIETEPLINESYLSNLKNWINFLNETENFNSFIKANQYDILNIFKELATKSSDEDRIIFLREILKAKNAQYKILRDKSARDKLFFDTLILQRAIKK